MILIIDTGRMCWFIICIKMIFPFYKCRRLNYYSPGLISAKICPECKLSTEITVFFVSSTYTMVFPVVMYGMWKLDCEESWAPKNWCFWTVVLEKTLESPLDCKEIQLVHPKGDQSWVFIGRTDVEAEAPVLWPPHVKSWLIGKDPDFGRDWGQEEKGMTEDEMSGWHHRLDGHESEWTPGVGDGQGGLVCCDSWGRKESDTTEWLNWTEPDPHGHHQMVKTKIYTWTSPNGQYQNQIDYFLCS